MNSTVGGPFAGKHRLGSGFAPFEATGGGLAQRFAATAARHESRVAVLADDQTVTYGELARHAGGVAELLRDTDPGPVGLLVPHGAGMVAAILGTLAAGRAYVPIDPGYPATRRAHMLEHAGVGTVLTADDIAGVAAPLRPEPAADLAYVLYTSGSTGRPKGVAQTQRAVLHAVANHVNNFRITPDDRLTLLSSFSFDMAITDLFSAVLSGAALVAVDIRRHGLTHLAEALDARGATVYHSTPTVYRYLADGLEAASARLPSLRAIVLGGETVSRRDVVRGRSLFAPGCVFVNGYGATEASFAVQNHIGPDDDVPAGVVPIGYPLPGYDIELDASGEIVICGPHVAAGYWRDEQLTAERFTERPGGRAYRTGDLARWRSDGSLVYLGRRDRQVKVRGHRVELGEIEAALAELPEVATSAAIPVPVADEVTITAFVEPVPGAAVAGPNLRAALARRLPDYLLPREVVVVPALPLTATGKVDAAALLAGAATLTEPGAVDSDETPVVTVWRAVLGSADPDRTFFDAGGHSLQLARAQQELERLTSIRLPLVAMLTQPTIAGWQRLLAKAGTDTEAGTDAEAGPPAVVVVVDERLADRMARRRARVARR
jgi:amino acid adenylation domain-containing protein